MQNRRNTEMGVVLFGSNETNNSLADADEGHYQHVYVMAKIGAVSFCGRFGVAAAGFRLLFLEYGYLSSRTWT